MLLLFISYFCYCKNTIEHCLLLLLLPLYFYELIFSLHFSNCIRLLASFYHFVSDNCYFYIWIWFEWVRHTAESVSIRYYSTSIFSIGIDNYLNGLFKMKEDYSMQKEFETKPNSKTQLHNRNKYIEFFLCVCVFWKKTWTRTKQNEQTLCENLSQFSRRVQHWTKNTHDFHMVFWYAIYFYVYIYTCITKL